MLADLALSGVGEVQLAGGVQLPQLAELEVQDAARLEVAAPLPALQRLVAYRVDAVQLDAALPALTSLRTGWNYPANPRKKMSRSRRAGPACPPWRSCSATAWRGWRALTAWLAVPRWALDKLVRGLTGG